MNLKQLEEFITKVKGKKIRRSGWYGAYVIPRTNPYIELGEFLFNGENIQGSINKYFIREGFDRDADGYRWEFYKEEIITDSSTKIVTEQFNNKCICELYSLMNNGCKCGGE